MATVKNEKLFEAIDNLREDIKFLAKLADKSVNIRYNRMYLVSGIINVNISIGKQKFLIECLGDSYEVSCKVFKDVFSRSYTISRPDFRAGNIFKIFGTIGL